MQLFGSTITPYYPPAFLAPDSFITANKDFSLAWKDDTTKKYSRGMADSSLMNAGAWLCANTFTAASGTTPSSV